MEVDDRVPIKEMRDLSGSLVEESAEEKDNPVPKDMETEVKIAFDHNAFEHGVMKLGEPTSDTCSECHGVLA